MNVETRFGIIGAGFIANVFTESARDTGAAPVAVASRHQRRAAEFADNHGGLRVFQSWSDLVTSDDIDAVYVATPTSVREDICLAAATHGKHVLAEKPFASLESLRRITAACHANGVAFMDATHFVHHPRTVQLKRELAERIGEVQGVYTSFFFPSMDRSNIRFDPQKEPTGAFGDMAWYSMRAVVEFAAAETHLVSGSGFIQSDELTGACVRSAGVLSLSDGCTSTWDVGYSVGTCVMDLNIYGQKGMISVDDFVLDWAGGFGRNVPGYPVGFIQRSGLANPTEFEEIITPAQRPQLVQMIQTFVEMTRDPKGKAVRASMRVSERTQSLLDAVWSRLTRI